MVLALVMGLSGSAFALSRGTNSSPVPAWIGEDGYEHYYIGNHTDEQLEIIISRIANGENIVFGDGVGFDSAPIGEDTSSLRWKSPGIDATHQWLTARGSVILTNDKPSLATFFTPSMIATIMQESDWPDKYEKGNEQNSLIYDYHFYDPEKNTSYFGKSTHANERFGSWYSSAVNAYARGDTTLSMQYLGRALHYLQDLGTPTHTGYTYNHVTFIFHGLKHLEYESFANNVRFSYTINTNANYGQFNYGILEGGRAVAINSRKEYREFVHQITNSPSSIQRVLSASQRDCASLLDKFYYDTH